MLRIIGGEKRGTLLFAPEGMDTRPLRDRVREALFNILQGRLAGRQVLDVFAGTGAVGLEALSRGATTGTFIEANARSARAIERNIAKLGYGARARLVTGKVPACLRHANSPEGGFDLVFLMPPYHTGLGQVALAELTMGGSLAPRAIAVLEIHRDEDTPPPEDWHVADERRYGITRLLFLARGAKPE